MAGFGIAPVNVMRNVDYSDLQKLMSGLQRMAGAFRNVADSVSPEFGAYMEYSGYLEEGTRKMAARPHIGPAVFETSKAILEEIVGFCVNMLDATLKKKAGASTAQFAETYKKAWIRALNGPTRARAVQMATELGCVEFGFHRRSIFGYPVTRGTSEILAEQNAAAQQRAGKKSTKKRKKK